MHMSTRIIIAPAIVALMLLIACGGGSKNSSPTPSGESPTITPVPVACTASHLYGALVSAEGAAGTQFLTIGISNTSAGCTLSGPPLINWYNEAGAKLPLQPATNSPCQPQAGDFTTCVFNGQITLTGEAPTPAPGVDGQAVAVVVVRNIDQFPECLSPTETAHSVGLEFPNVTPDLRVELLENIALQICETQVTLQGYGLLAVPQE
jgi:hypothetical protein